MVRGPGRSKACGTCKRRRKGCDLRRPVCFECESRGLLCSGYDDSAHFVMYGSSHTSKGLINLHGSTKTPKDIPVDRLSRIGESMNASMLASLYMNHSWHSILGNAHKQPPFGWIVSLSDVHGNGTASNLALKALMLARSCSQMDHADMSVASYRMYNGGLAAVARNVRTNKDTVGDDTLAAILLLALYEILQGSSNRVSSWINHMGGAYSLVQKRGPGIQNTYNGRSLFRDFRTHGIIYAIGRRKTSFLSKLSWLGDPFQDAIKSEKDQLLDIMATIPSILEIADALIAECDLERSLSMMYTMRKAYATITMKLARWRSGFQTKRNVGSQWYRRSRLFSEPGQEHLQAMFPLIMYFPDVETAELDLLYWTTAIILHGNFYLLLHDAQNSSLAMLPIPSGFPHLNPGRDSYSYEDLFDPLDTECNMRIFVNNIAESMEYFLEPGIGVLAVSTLVFPMALAMAFLDFFHDPRLEFFLAVADKIEYRHGVPLRDFLQNIPNQNILRLVKTAVSCSPN